MTDFTKSKGTKSAVRQKRGPGMNLGLKKPRKNTFPKVEPYSPSKAMKKAQKVVSGSYLSPFETGGMGKQRKKSR